MLVNKITKQWIDAYIKHPKAAVLLDSEDETSFKEVTDFLHKELIGKSNNPYIVISSEDKKTIGVEKIRELKKQLSLRANNSSNAISRMIVIEEAHAMTLEAQNALLKLIEELPDKTIVCLTSSHAAELLATVTSRCFIIKLLPLEKETALSYAKTQGVTDSDAERFYAMSAGFSGLFISLIDDDPSGVTRYIIGAKTFLSSTVFERQKLITGMVKNPEDIPMQLRGLRIIALAGLRAGEPKAKLLYKKILEEVALTEKQLSANVSTKLALLRLSVSI